MVSISFILPIYQVYIIGGDISSIDVRSGGGKKMQKQLLNVNQVRDCDMTKEQPTRLNLPAWYLTGSDDGSIDGSMRYE